MTLDLDAIRERDADYNDVFEAQASMSKDIAHRLVAWPVADRRALLAAYDTLAAECESLRKDAECYHHLIGLIRANPTALAGEVLEWFTGESHE